MIKRSATRVHTMSDISPVRGRNKVRIFWENTVEEIDIPIYDIPVQTT